MRTVALASSRTVRSNSRRAVATLLVAALAAGCAVGPDDESSTGATGEDLTASEHAAYDYFLGKGLTPVQAAGVVGNLMQESNVNPSAVQSGGPGRGIAQWSAGGRWDSDGGDNVVAYASAHGASAWSLDLQLDFIWFELTNFSGYGLAQLRASTSVADATIAFETRFEGCGTCEQSTRISYAQQVLSAYGGDSAPSAASQTAVAFQANTGSLWLVDEHGARDAHLGMMAGTSPAVGRLSDGGYVVAFQANTGNLWIVDEHGHAADQHLGMMAGTSPAIAGLAGGGYVVAFEANTTSLWTTGTVGTTDHHLGMMSGTSPSVAALAGGGYEVAFQANTTSLWTVGDAGNRDWSLGMNPHTSPSIAGLAHGGFQVAFQANTTSLWTVGTAGNRDWHLGMRDGTSPSITALPGGGFEAAFQANTTSLWLAGDAGTGDQHLGMMDGTSPTIRAFESGVQLHFQANTTSLWSAGAGGTRAFGLGMAEGTSPSAM